MEAAPGLRRAGSASAPSRAPGRWPAAFPRDRALVHL